MGTIRFYMDEDVHLLLARVLRDRGIDAIAAGEVGRLTYADERQFEYAIEQNRVFLTFNVKHFVPLATSFINAGNEFPGLIVCLQVPFRELLRRVQKLIGAK